MSARVRGNHLVGRAQRLGLAVGFFLVWFATPAGAQPHVERPDAILSEARTAPGTRAALIAHARAVQRGKPSEAADALMYAGQSAERSGLADSAAVCYRQAAALRTSNEESLALTDVLLQRARAKDLIEAYQVVATMLARTPGEAPDRPEVVLRSMWLHHLAAHPDSAVAMFRAIDGRHVPEGIWAVRAARVLLEDGNDAARAGQLLTPLEVRARGQDLEVHDLFLRAAAAFGRPAAEVSQIISAEIRRGDDAVQPLLDRLDARRVPFSASDGFLLSSIVRPAPPGAPAAVIISMGDTLANYDSLIVHLHEAGFAVILFEPRGHGLSVGPPCALPFRWTGREHALEERTALDAVEALQALAEVGPIDSARTVVVGVGFSARAALLAAEQQPNFRAIVLASAEPARVDRGMMIASVERLRRPLFLETAPEDLVDLYYFSDALYQAGDRKASRVSSGAATGRYAAQFNHDATSGPRLRKWLREVIPAKR
jgi:pimeloyl-ACP methyl ester carboxylesterase